MSVTRKLLTVNRVAHHEAGHAVAGAALGLSIKLIEMDYQDVSGKVWCGKEYERLSPEAKSVIALAGLAGERFYEPHPGIVYKTVRVSRNLCKLVSPLERSHLTSDDGTGDLQQLNDLIPSQVSLHGRSNDWCNRSLHTAWNLLHTNNGIYRTLVRLLIDNNNHGVVEINAREVLARVRRKTVDPMPFNTLKPDFGRLPRSRTEFRSKPRLFAARCIPGGSRVKGKIMEANHEIKTKSNYAIKELMKVLLPSGKVTYLAGGEPHAFELVYPEDITNIEPVAGKVVFIKNAGTLLDDHWINDGQIPVTIEQLEEAGAVISRLGKDDTTNIALRMARHGGLNLAVLSVQGGKAVIEDAHGKTVISE